MTPLRSAALLPLFHIEFWDCSVFQPRVHDCCGGKIKLLPLLAVLAVP